jgi:uncharacterized iron-regulated membrane protein
MKAILLRLHRWMTLVFALPLALIILTGLVLSLEPIAQDVATKPGSLNQERMLAMLDKHDPQGKTRTITMQAYEGRLTLSGSGNGAAVVDLTSGEAVDGTQGSTLSTLFRSARGLHEHLIFDLDWLVTVSTFAMLVIIALGVAMGWPRLRQSVSGWHHGIAWFGLPLLILSPLTGLALVYGISFSSMTPQDRMALPPIREAVKLLGEKQDISTLIWLRNRGGRMLARVNEGGTFRVYQISLRGVSETPTNWPRALHEGNFAGLWSGIMVLATSLGFIGLMGTGLTIYLRRALRKQNRVRGVVAQTASP